jgi:hypothetical protein
MEMESPLSWFGKMDLVPLENLHSFIDLDRTVTIDFYKIKALWKF